LDFIPVFVANGVGKFIEHRREQIINNMYMIYACRIYRTEISFPLAIVPANHGSANHKIIGILDTAREMLAALHLHLQKFSIDGDQECRLLIEPIIDQLQDLSMYQLDRALLNQMPEI
jgi:hypothetical protein